MIRMGKSIRHKWIKVMNIAGERVIDSVCRTLPCNLSICFSNFPFHYENMSMQYKAIFFGIRNEKI